MALVLSGSTGIVEANIANSAVTAGKLGSGAARTNFGAGAVLQVLQTSTTAYIATTSTGFVTTGFAISITPIATTSKVLITVAGGGAYVGTSGGVSMHSTIYRNSTNLGNPTYGLERVSSPGGNWVLVPHSMSYLDSPSSASSITYTVYFRSATGSEVQFSNDDRGVITLTVMEIAG